MNFVIHLLVKSCYFTSSISQLVSYTLQVALESTGFEY